MFLCDFYGISVASVQLCLQGFWSFFFLLLFSPRSASSSIKARHMTSFHRLDQYVIVQILIGELKGSPQALPISIRKSSFFFLSCKWHVRQTLLSVTWIAGRNASLAASNFTAFHIPFAVCISLAFGCAFVVDRLRNYRTFSWFDWKLENTDKFSSPFRQKIKLLCDWAVLVFLGYQTEKRKQNDAIYSTKT